ncbi:hypothetical protein JCM14469_06280 [Desulfatiferula olefinivorans]
MKGLVILMLAALCFPAPARAETAYVHSARADVHERPSMGSPTVGRLSGGDRVEILGNKGSWAEIDYGSGQGFVYGFLLNTRPAGAREKVYSRLRSFFSKIESISGKSRRRPSSYTATAAARGLREKREHFAALYQSDYDSLAFFEAIEIPEEEALAFIRKGVADESRP